MNDQMTRRNTKQRQVILEELRRLTSHPSAATLHEIVRRRLPKISLGTVYRNLELLAQSGLIRKLDLGSGEARFDGIVTPHYHIRCVKCGRVTDAHDPDVNIAYGEDPSAEGFHVLGHQLEFVGICPQCQGVSQVAVGASLN
jgi:Fur family ferric uptake transcriptional regulator